MRNELKKGQSSKRSPGTPIRSQEKRTRSKAGLYLRRSMKRPATALEQQRTKNQTKKKKPQKPKQKKKTKTQPKKPTTKKKKKKKKKKKSNKRE